MRILVTGGAGFIGANFVRAALAAGHEVTVLDTFSQCDARHLAGLPIRIVEGDILDITVVAEMGAHDAVVHLAAQTGVPGSIANPRRDCELNIVGTLNLLEACRHAGKQGAMPRLVFASSNAPLGRQKPPATEDKAPLPISPYGASKLAAEGYCLAYHGSWGLPTVVLRFGNVYGPYSAHKKSVVAKFISEVLRGQPITIDGDGQQTRDFIYVDDLCGALLKAVRSTISGEIFQIATGVETSISELAEIVRQVVAPNLRIEHGPARQGDIRKNYSSIAKAGRLLGWRPVTDIREGVSRTWRWFREQKQSPDLAQTFP